MKASNTTVSLKVAIEHWPLARKFSLSRGSKTEAVVVTVELNDGRYQGRGECVPYARYNETPETVQATIEKLRPSLRDGLTRENLQYALPSGAARNALDCAFWDLEAKRSGSTIWELLGIPVPRSITTAYTISLDTPEAMGAAAAQAASWPILKIKLGREDIASRLAAVRQGAPRAELIVDANEGWSAANLDSNIAVCSQAGVTLIEQPLPEDEDQILADISRSVPVCADESVRDTISLKKLLGKYDAVNVKLDKAGGLTEALTLVGQAASMGFSLMAGCMVATSLALAPAFVFAAKARVIDLDGPLWLAKDRAHGLRYERTHIYPPVQELWG